MSELKTYYFEIERTETYQITVEAENVDQAIDMAFSGVGVDEPDHAESLVTHFEQVTKDDDVILKDAVATVEVDIHFNYAHSGKEDCDKEDLDCVANVQTQFEAYAHKFKATDVSVVDVVVMG